MKRSKVGKSVPIPPAQWIGVKRVVPSLLSTISPSLRAYFSEIEELRLRARIGALDVRDARNLCVLDGVSACGYSMVLGLIGLGLHFLAFGLFGLAGGDVFLKVFIAYFLLFPCLPTAAVEACEALRATLVERISGEEAQFRLLGPVAYGVSFLISTFALFLFFQMIS